MRKMMQISFLTGIVILFCLTTGYCQQRPSQRSFISVMNEVKQKEASRNKMLQQIRQTTASNFVLPNASTQTQPSASGTVAPTPAQNTLNLPGTNQPANKQINSQLKAPMKKQ